MKEERVKLCIVYCAVYTGVYACECLNIGKSNVMPVTWCSSCINSSSFRTDEVE